MSKTLFIADGNKPFVKRKNKHMLFMIVTPVAVCASCQLRSYCD